MAEWILWFGATAIVVIFELFTGTFYLLMIASGLAAGGAVALAGANTAIQFLCAAVVGATATLLLRRSRLGRFEKSDASHDPNVNLDIGQALNVPEWRLDAGGRASARVMYRGALWDVELSAGSARPGRFEISEIRGSRLIVAEMPTNH
jgi:membrane protein implicated in regulation of membrane protease activity